MKVLLTGFEPFADIEVNPSQVVVEHFADNDALLDGIELITEVLPVGYQSAEERISELYKKHKPDIVLMLGVAQSRDCLCLERIALNLDDTPIEDNDGELREGQTIVSRGTLAYQTTLPVDELYKYLTEQDIPIKISNHAGTYICNHVLYTMLHQTKKTAPPCGFIHLPSTDAVSLETMVRAIWLTIRFLTR